MCVGVLLQCLQAPLTDEEISHRSSEAAATCVILCWPLHAAFVKLWLEWLTLTSHQPSFTPPYNLVPLSRNSSRNPFRPESRHEAHTPLAEPSEPRHARTHSRSREPHPDYASDASDASDNPLHVGPENCEPDELFNFINTSTIPQHFYHHYPGTTQPPVVLRSQRNLGNGGDRRR